MLKFASEGLCELSTDETSWWTHTSCKSNFTGQWQFFPFTVLRVTRRANKSNVLSSIHSLHGRNAFVCGCVSMANGMHELICICVQMWVHRKYKDGYIYLCMHEWVCLVVCKRGYIIYVWMHECVYFLHPDTMHTENRSMMFHGHGKWGRLSNETEAKRPESARKNVCRFSSEFGKQANERTMNNIEPQFQSWDIM